MKQIAKIVLLVVFICPTLGRAQDTNSSPRPSDKQAQKQAERERKEAERKRKAEEKEAERLQNQLGVRCSRLKGTRKQ